MILIVRHQCCLLQVSAAIAAAVVEAESEDEMVSPSPPSNVIRVTDTVSVDSLSTLVTAVKASADCDEGNANSPTALGTPGPVAEAKPMQTSVSEHKDSARRQLFLGGADAGGETGGSAGTEVEADLVWQDDWDELKLAAEWLQSSNIE